MRYLDALRNIMTTCLSWQERWRLGPIHSFRRTGNSAGADSVAEEPKLLRTFGDEYATYGMHVQKVVPTIDAVAIPTRLSDEHFGG